VYQGFSFFTCCGVTLFASFTLELLDRLILMNAFRMGFIVTVDFGATIKDKDNIYTENDCVFSCILNVRHPIHLSSMNIW
jgi:hypothetical protein